jgi:hypothetical protein
MSWTRANLHLVEDGIDQDHDGRQWHPSQPASNPEVELDVAIDPVCIGHLSPHRSHCSTSRRQNPRPVVDIPGQ